MSGYDIKVLFQKLDWLIESPSYGSLYPTLHGLLEEGLVSVDVVPGAGRPARKIYRVTEAGAEALRAWLAQSPDAQLSTRSFLMRLILAGHFSPDTLRSWMTHRRRQVLSYLADQAGQAVDHAMAENLGQHLIHDYGATVAKAELAWLDDQLAQLAQMPAA